MISDVIERAACLRREFMFQDAEALLLNSGMARREAEELYVLYAQWGKFDDAHRALLPEWRDDGWSALYKGHIHFYAAEFAQARDAYETAYDKIGWIPGGRADVILLSFLLGHILESCSAMARLVREGEPEGNGHRIWIMRHFTGAQRFRQQFGNFLPPPLPATESWPDHVKPDGLTVRELLDDAVAVFNDRSRDRSDRFARAQIYLREALDMEPDCVAAIGLFARLQLRYDPRADVSKLFDRCRQLRPFCSAPLLAYEAVINRKKWHLVRARSLSEQSIRQFPANSDAQTVRILTDLILGKWRDEGRLLHQTEPFVIELLKGNRILMKAGIDLRSRR